MNIPNWLNPFHQCPQKEAEARLQKTRLAHLDNIYNQAYYTHMAALTEGYSEYLQEQIQYWKDKDSANGNTKVSTLPDFFSDISAPGTSPRD